MLFNILLKFRLRYRIVFLLVLLFNINVMFSPLFAQQLPKPCGTDEAMQQLYKLNPDSKRKDADFNKRLTLKTKFINGEKYGDGQQYIIPVVFHVFGTDFKGYTVDDNTILAALSEVNKDFRGFNEDFNDVIDLFQPIRGILDIEFRLAKLDPKGNSTTGILYHPSESGLGNNGSNANDKIKQYAWDNYKYMNIYIMLDLYSDGVTNNSGIAWLPDEWMSDNNLARVVYNGRYLWGNDLDSEFQATLTHEIGHWLGLHHTFRGGCSSPGDNVDDTPATSVSWGCNSVEMCTGAGPANTSNYMDYSECRRMFTIGQIDRVLGYLDDHAARNLLWQQDNLVATGTDDAGVGAHLLFDKTIWCENDSNDGTISDIVNISAQSGAQFAATGDLVFDYHYTTHNVPTGLSVAINITDASSGTVSLTGQALVHVNNSDISNLQVIFLDPAISGGASQLNTDTGTFGINFNEPYDIVYVDIEDITVDADNTWKYFDLSLPDADYGCWISDGLRFETYQKPMVCEESTRNITLLNHGDSISPANNWIDGGAFPDEHYIYSSDYQQWLGQSGYMGFSFTLPDEPCSRTARGWFRISVNDNGASYTLYDYAYTTNPNGSIKAGQKDSDSQDFQPPDAPTELKAISITDNSINLEWNQSTDNVGVSGYNIYSQGSFVSFTTTTRTVISGLNPETSYAIVVRAVDNSGNESGESNRIDITTESGSVNPEPPAENSDSSGSGGGGGGCFIDMLIR